MAERSWLAEQFEQSRPHLQAVAYSMLGSVSEAQDAVQEAWLRLDRSEGGHIGDLQGWLTTVVGRISLDMLRARKARLPRYERLALRAIGIGEFVWLRDAPAVIARPGAADRS